MTGQNSQDDVARPSNKNVGTWAAVGTFIGILLILAWRVYGPDADVAAEVPSLATCDSPAARAAVQNAVEQNAMRNIATLRLLDMRDVREMKASPTQRLCSATLVLNNGAAPTRFIVSLSTTGDTLVELGDDLDIASISASSQPSAGPPPAAATPAAPQGGAMEPSDIISRHPAAYADWRRIVTAAGRADDEWLLELNGTGSAGHLTVEGQQAVRFYICEPHNCGYNYALALVLPNSGRAVGILHVEEGDEVKETVIGQPTAAERACLDRLNALSDATSCE